MEAPVNMNQLAGLSVRLRHGIGLAAYGGLNSIFLSEEGYVGEPVPVVETNDKCAVVRLLSGHLLTIYPRDVE